MKLTEAQKQAIYTKDKTILVSAGAGSGKTTVLTKRLINRIINGASLDDFLVITFTKASAADMKDSIHKSLNEEFAKKPQDTHLFFQIGLLAGDNISTVHSFFLKTIKENYARLGLAPTVRVADDAEIAALIQESMIELFEKLYKDSDKDFLELIKSFGNKNTDRAAIDFFIETYNKIRSFEYYDRWLEDKVDHLVTENEIVQKDFFETKIGLEIKNNIIVLLSSAKAKIDNMSIESKKADTLEMIEQKKELTAFIDEAELSIYENYESFFNLVNNYNQNDAAKKLCTEIASLFYENEIPSSSKLKGDYLYNLKLTSVMHKVMQKFDKEFTLRKSQLNLLDYSDIEHYFLQLLEVEDDSGFRKPSKLCSEIQSKFTEILVDEYQDINPLQDHIFKLISRKNNRFMVGDLKQSIYRFRNAHPDIFLNYKELFPKCDQSSESDNCKIFLKENFRCSKPIIDFVNHVFAKVTKDNRFEKEYIGEELVFAKPTDSKNDPVNISLFGYINTEEKIESDIKEAEYVAKEIKRLVTVANDEGKKYDYKDIAVLMSAIKGRVDVFIEQFKQQGIPYSLDRPERFFELPEIRLITSILRFVNNRTSDIALAGILRSPLYNFTSEELNILRTRSPKGTYLIDSLLAISNIYKSNKSYLNTGVYKVSQEINGFPESLINKKNLFVSDFERFRTKSKDMPLHRFVWYILENTDFFTIVGNEPDGPSKRKNLLLFYKIARDFNQTGKKSISDFLSYLYVLSTGQNSGFTTSNDNDNAVNILSIHKSKGLEYPVCFLANASRRFNTKDFMKKIILSRSEGFAGQIHNFDNFLRTKTIHYSYVSKKEEAKSLEEELRKLYVALTRAKDKLYITGSIKVSDKKKDEKVIYPTEANTFLKWLLYAIKDEEKVFYRYNFRYAKDETEGPEIQAEGKARSTCFESELLDKDAIDKILSYSYPHIEAIKIPAKATVTQIVSQKEQRFNIDITQPKAKKTKMKDPLEKGIANHAFLQYVDYEKVDAHGVQSEAMRLLEEQILSKEQFEFLDFDDLSAFFESDVYRELRKSNEVFREKSFSVLVDAKLFGSLTKEKVLLQGQIDCFYKNEENGYTLIDYKTDYVGENPQILIDRYKEQLNLYSIAVKEMTGTKSIKSFIYSVHLKSFVPVSVD